MSKLVRVCPLSRSSFGPSRCELATPGDNQITCSALIAEVISPSARRDQVKNDPRRESLAISVSAKSGETRARRKTTRFSHRKIHSTLCRFYCRAEYDSRQFYFLISRVKMNFMLLVSAVSARMCM